MITAILSGYLCLWVLFFVVLLLDWLLGLDKVSSYLEDIDNISPEHSDVFAPLIGSAIFGIIFAILYFCTGIEIAKYGSYIMAGLSLGGFILLIAMYSVYHILCKVRNFFIHLRKGA